MKDLPMDRSHAPMPGPIKPFSFPTFASRRLANGMRFLWARVPQVPLFGLEVVVPAGSQHDGDRPGLATFHAGLLDEGTTEHSALELANRIENLGGYLASGATWDTAYVSGTFLADHLREGVELLSEICRAPRFPEDEIERQRQQRLTEILRSQDLPNTQADLAFSQVIYRGTAYENPLIGTAESIETLSRNDLLDFYRRHFVADGSTVIAVGDFDPDALQSHIEDGFGDWSGGQRPTPPQIEPLPLARTEVHLVDRPDAVQTRLQLGHAGIPRTHPDFGAFLILNTVFGGKFTSRINLNLREKHGFTYGANSRLIRRCGPGPFTITTSVRTDIAGAAVNELIHELGRVREEWIGEEELRESSDYLIGAFPYTLQTIGNLIQRLEDLVVFDMPEDLYTYYPGTLGEISGLEARRAARDHLHPDRLAIVAVGPAAALRPQLETLGPVHLWQG